LRYCSNIPESNLHTIYPQVDVDTNNVYASALTGNTIYSMSHLNCVIQTIGTSTPVGNIALDPNRQYIYYTSNNNNLLSRMNYGGTNIVNVTAFPHSLLNVKTDPVRDSIYFFYDQGISSINFQTNYVTNTSNIPNFSAFNVDSNSGDFYFGYENTESYYNSQTLSYTKLFSLSTNDYIIDSFWESQVSIIFVHAGHFSDNKFDIFAIPFTFPTQINGTIGNSIFTSPSQISSMRGVYCTSSTCGICGTNIFTFNNVNTTPPSNSLSGGAVAGIVIGVLLVVSIVIILVVLYFKKPNSKFYDNAKDKISSIFSGASYV